jgi:hypothetical protein
MKNKEIIFYTDSRIDERIASVVREYILKSELPIISVSLKPLDFGENIVLDLEPGIITMFKQILKGLEISNADVVYFVEHDVLYSKSHFDFTPEKDNIFYYNTNNFRWDFPHDRAITYYGLRSLSGMCVDRIFAIEYYRKLLEVIEKNGWSLKYGFEPGIKSRRRGGIIDSCFEDWTSEYPNVDIRHHGTLTPRKTHLDSFKHPPDINSWKEVKLDEIPGWKLKELFNLR